MYNAPKVEITTLNLESWFFHQILKPGKWSPMSLLVPHSEHTIHTGLLLVFLEYSVTVPSVVKQEPHLQ